MAVVTEKLCPRCDRELSVEHFYKDRRCKSGFSTWCKECCREGSLKSYHGRNPERRREVAYTHKLRYRYGLSDEQIKGLPTSCEICGNDSNLVVDHNHITGSYRGRLCRKCNSAIGMLNDDPNLIRLAMVYLERG